MDLKKYLILATVGLAIYILLSFGIFFGIQLVQSSDFGGLGATLMGPIGFLTFSIIMIIATFSPSFIVAVLSMRYFGANQKEGMIAACAYGLANLVLGIGILLLFRSRILPPAPIYHYLEPDYVAYQRLFGAAVWFSTVTLLGAFLGGMLGTALCGFLAQKSVKKCQEIKR